MADIDKKNGQSRLVRDGRKIKAHRYAWILERGPIPFGLWVLHKCDTPNCIRVSHLYLGTHEENMRDMAVRERAQKIKLTGAQVNEIRAMLAAGTASTSEIAERFGVSKPTIQDIKHGRTRTHVPALDPESPR